MSTTLALVLYTSNAAKLLSATARGTLLSNLRPMGRGKDFLNAWGCETELLVTSAFLLSPEAVCVYAGSSHPPLPALAAGESRGAISDAELLYVNTSDRYCGFYTQNQDARFPIPRSRAEAAETLPEYLADFVGALVDLDAEPLPTMHGRDQDMWGDDDDAHAPAEAAPDSWCADNLFASDDADDLATSDDDVMRAIEADTFDNDEESDEEISRLFGNTLLRDAEAHEATLGLDEDDEDEDEDDEDEDEDDDDR